jgi:hypothetical protein
VRDELEHRHPGDTVRRANQRPPEPRHQRGVGECEQQAAGARDHRSDQEHATRAETIDQHAGRDLHGGVGVVVESRKVPQPGSRQREVAHQIRRQRRRRDALKEAEQIESRGQPPHQEGQPWRRVAHEVLRREPPRGRPGTF